jgi:Methylamine utilisation protein MauE
VGLAVPPLEAFLAVAFLSGSLLEGALPLAAVMLAAFSAATAINLSRGRRVSCGCFGDPDERVSPRSLGRLAFLVAGALALGGLLVGGVRPVTPSRLVAEGSPAVSSVVAAGGLAVFLLLAALWILSPRELAYVARHLARSAPRGA